MMVVSKNFLIYIFAFFVNAILFIYLLSGGNYYYTLEYILS